MRIGVPQTRKWAFFAAIVLCVAILLLLNVVGHWFGWQRVSLWEASAVADRYEVQSELLRQATDYTGVPSPEAAVELWADGVRLRSAAMQYTVMTQELKSRYAADLETSAPNWVTGMSSPWVEGFVMGDTITSTPNQWQIDVTFVLRTSAGQAGEYKASLIVVVEEPFFRINRIAMEAGLYPYTGFLLSPTSTPTPTPAPAATPSPTLRPAPTS